MLLGKDQVPSDEEYEVISKKADEDANKSVKQQDIYAERESVLRPDHVDRW